MIDVKEYLKSIEILPDDKENIEFWERENKKTHTSYESEILFFSCIMHGDTLRLGKCLEDLFNSGIVAGKLSEDNLRQMKYWAVSCVTIATRYAIQGGLPEMEAYNLSDRFIRDIDHIDDENCILNYLIDASFVITERIKAIKIQNNYPAPVRKCVSYIDKNLHDRISLDDLAEISNLSKDYLSQLFRKTTGITVTEYIKKRRLDSAKKLLDRDSSIGHTAYALGFCSESYFISCFKKEFGMTPKEYIKNKGKL